MINIPADDLKVINSILDNNILMSVATFADYPWISSAYYVCDNELNFYFLSQPTTEHVAAIKKNADITWSVANSLQRPEDEKMGFYANGTATIVNDLSKIKWMFTIYNRIFPSTKKKYTFKNFELKIIASNVVCATPKRIKVFAPHIFTDGGVKVWE